MEFTVYNDGVISVSLVAEDENKAERNLWHLAVRWLPPQPYRDKAGNVVQTTNVMRGETEAFRLPHTFGAAVGKKLIEQKVSGLSGFHDDGFAKMIAWLVDMEELTDAMCY
ncbi:MAG: hypothetical protein NTZ32_15120 [Planctomycetales bacterium]|nr:hypothetical protein [Planctomycetales bacterium]